MIAERFNWISGATPAGAFRAEVKIRYRSQPQMALVQPLDDGRVRITFDQPQRDISPGQAAVVYQGDVCLGGGLIAKFDEALDRLESKDQTAHFTV